MKTWGFFSLKNQDLGGLQIGICQLLTLVHISNHFDQDSENKEKPRPEKQLQKSTLNIIIFYSLYESLASVP